MTKRHASPVGTSANPNEQSAKSPGLVRGVGVGQATALNMIDMIGVGPFITIPLIVAAMGGPQAMLGWGLGAVLAISDGLVWAELGAAMPMAGGPYQYLKTIYGERSLGRLMSFLFVWQLTFTAPLSIASGCIGLAGYSTYLWPALSQPMIPPIHLLGRTIDVPLTAAIAAGTCVLAVFLLYRKITVIGRLSSLLWVGVLLTIAWVVVSGLSHFNAAQAFSFPPGAFTLNHGFFLGLGSALLVSIYDYWGYYNVCFLGSEIKDPERTIPRAIVYSTMLVGGIYIVMNISILGVVRWQDLQAMAHTNDRLYVVSTFMEAIHGRWAGNLATILVMWTAFASVFSLMLGYSRVPYAAATDGNYFKAFARVHPRLRIPNVSLLVLGGVACVFCFFKLIDVIKYLVVTRILIQFIAQIAGLVILRWRHPEFPRPFRMWLYPLPAIIAFVGFLYVLVGRPMYQKELICAAMLLSAGTVVYLARAIRRREWPFASSTRSV
jgi:basic amino acid/polyamine antiporter, APA family